MGAGKASFNPHTHAGCDSIFLLFGVEIGLFQSTHPRRVWHTLSMSHHRTTGVSIHTPTQGVTFAQCPIIPDILRFNPHTHAGCDLWYVNCKSNDIAFQSTHPRRVWHVPESLCRLLSCFNPHTHAGCDTRHLSITLLSIMFQSTHPRRVWQFQIVCRQPLNKFQSTHPRRVWPIANWVETWTYGFNPHTHAGCDFSFTVLVIVYTRFNPHTHAGCDNFSR